VSARVLDILILGKRCSKQEMRGSMKNTIALGKFLLFASQIIWHKQRSLIRTAVIFPQMSSRTHTQSFAHILYSMQCK
jgi:hypothetical protein